MSRPGAVVRRYLFKFLFRLAVFLAVAAVYLLDRQALDFRRRDAFLLSGILWLCVLLSMLAQLSSSSRLTTGCMKQYPSRYDPVPGYDPEALRLIQQLEPDLAVMDMTGHHAGGTTESPADTDAATTDVTGITIPADSTEAREGIPMTEETAMATEEALATAGIMTGLEDPSVMTEGLHAIVRMAPTDVLSVVREVERGASAQPLSRMAMIPSWQRRRGRAQMLSG